MITEKHYINGQHPLDRIYDEKNFLAELSKVLDDRFDKLAKELKMNKDGEDWLFDYIFNGSPDIDFEEYLEKFGVTYEDCVEPWAFFKEYYEPLSFKYPCSCWKCKAKKQTNKKCN